MKLRKFKISGMHCSHCENNVKNALSKLEGIENVVVNRATSTVEVSGSVDSSAIEKIIKSIGFIYDGEL